MRADKIPSKIVLIFIIALAIAFFADCIPAYALSDMDNAVLDDAQNQQIPLTMEDGASVASNQGGIITTAGPSSTSFTMNELKRLKANGATAIVISSDGSLVIKFQGTDIVKITNSVVNNGVITPKPGSPSLKIDGSSIWLDKPATLNSDGSITMSAGTNVQIDTNSNGILDTTISTRDEASLVFGPPCRDRNENCISITRQEGGDLLSISGSGIDADLQISKSKRPLGSIRALSVFPRSKSNEPEISVSETIVNGARKSLYSKMMFSKAGTTFYAGTRPISLNHITNNYIDKNGKTKVFNAVKTGDKWSFQLCDPGDQSLQNCVSVGEEDNGRMGKIPDPNYVISDEEYEDVNYVTADEIDALLKKYDSGLQGMTIDGMSLSEYIIKAARENGINPFLILVRLEVEQGLVTSTKKPTQEKLNKATGCGCSGGSCTGIKAQIDCTAGLMKKYDAQLSGGGYSTSNWRVGTPKTTQDQVKVTPANVATAALYTYNPIAGHDYGASQTTFGGVYRFWDYWNQFSYDLGEIKAEEEEVNI